MMGEPTWSSFLHKRIGNSTLEHVWNSRFTRLPKRLMFYILINSVSLEKIIKTAKEMPESEKCPVSDSEDNYKEVDQDEEADEEEDEEEDEDEDNDKKDQAQEKEEVEENSDDDDKNDQAPEEGAEEEEEEEEKTRKKEEWTRKQRNKIQKLFQSSDLQGLFERLVDPSVQKWILANSEVWEDCTPGPLKSAENRYGKVRTTPSSAIWMAITAAIGFDWIFYGDRCKLFCFCGMTCGIECTCTWFKQVHKWFDLVLLFAGSTENLDAREPPSSSSPPVRPASSSSSDEKSSRKPPASSSREPSSSSPVGPASSSSDEKSSRKPPASSSREPPFKFISREPPTIALNLERIEIVLGQASKNWTWTCVLSALAALTDLDGKLLWAFDPNIIISMILSQFSNDATQTVVQASRFCKIYPSCSQLWKQFLEEFCKHALILKPVFLETFLIKISLKQDTLPLEPAIPCRECRHTSICTNQVLKKGAFFRFLLSQLSDLFTLTTIPEVYTWCKRLNVLPPVFVSDKSSSQRVRVLSFLKNWCVTQGAGPLIHRAVEETQLIKPSAPPPFDVELCLGSRFSFSRNVLTKTQICARWSELAQACRFAPSISLPGFRFWSLDIPSFHKGSFLNGIVIATQLTPCLVWKGALSTIFKQLYQHFMFQNNEEHFETSDFNSLFELMKHHFGNCGEYKWNLPKESSKWLLRYEQILERIEKREKQFAWTHQAFQISNSLQTLDQIRKFKECLITLFCAGLSMRRWRLSPPFDENPLWIIYFWMKKDDVLQLAFRKMQEFNSDVETVSWMKIQNEKEEKKAEEKIDASPEKEKEEKDSEEKTKRKRDPQARDVLWDWDPVKVWFSVSKEPEKSESETVAKEPGKRFKTQTKTQICCPLFESGEMELVKMEFADFKWDFPYSKESCSMLEKDPEAFPENQTAVFLAHLYSLVFDEKDPIATLFLNLNIMESNPWEKRHMSSTAVTVAELLRDVASFKSSFSPKQCMREHSHKFCTTAFSFLSTVYNDLCFNFDIRLLKSL